jgi:hypothetical protein
MVVLSQNIASVCTYAIVVSKHLFLRKTPFLPKKWRKSQKIVIVTLNRGYLLLSNECFPLQKFYITLCIIMALCTGGLRRM